MAQNCPISVDVVDVQFKLHDKVTIFGGSGLRSHVNLLATASAQGLLFGGNPNAPELKVAILKDLVNAASTETQVLMRTVPLPGVPNVLACSADGTMLAVNYSQHDSGFLHIYSTASFTTPNIKSLYNIRISPEMYATTRQILWNPVITTSLAVVLNNGAVSVYTLKDGGQFELHSLEKAHQVKSGCWSPKGKQIVLGFTMGKLQQFKPDLTPAKTIVCPPGVHPAPFDTIAIQWLSTFQFAVVFLEVGEEKSPAVHIVNAPKGGVPSFTNYFDICFSANGPRTHQTAFTHIPQWNILLMTSANGVEVGIMGTKETTDTPTWVQYMLLDEARVELPLTDNKEETYPIGFAFDTSALHQLTIGENQLPVMPMVHVLSSNGQLLSFNFLNLTQGVVDICSPPPPITDTSGQFRPLEAVSSPNLSQKQDAVAVTPTPQNAGSMNFSFAPQAGTSTPSEKEKSGSLFGGLQMNLPSAADSQSGQSSNAPTQGTFTSSFGMPSMKAPLNLSTGGFGGEAAAVTPTPTQFGSLPPATSTPNSFAGFGSLTTGGTQAFSGFGAKPTEFAPNAATMPAQQQHLQQPQQQQQSQLLQQQKQQQQMTTASAPKAADINKPLYTVPPTFAAPPASVALAGQQQKAPSLQSPAASAAAAAAKSQINSAEIDIIINQMITVQINSFDMELNQRAHKSKGLLSNLGNLNEMKNNTKRLNDLQEIIKQANDRDFEMDVQNLRHSLNESYAMLAECRTKLEMYQNPEITRLTSISTYDPINRRQLAKLQSYVATNQAQLQMLRQQVDEEWAIHQDRVRRNSKLQMHIPCLDGVYQRMTKLKDKVARQRTRLNYLKTQLKQRGMFYKPANDMDLSKTNANTEKSSMESLADSILSMSLMPVVNAHRSKLSEEKLNAIRNFARQQQQITIIRPQRPDRVGLKSEVILESKLRNEYKAREGAVTNLTKMQQDKLPPNATNSTGSEANQPQTLLAKPTATKPNIAGGQTKNTFAPPAQAQMTAPNFSFGGTSPFVKTSVATSKSEDTATSKESFSGGGSLPAFNISTSKPSTFGQPLITPTTTTPTTFKPEPVKDLSTTLQTPISFSAKVVGGGTTKPFASMASTTPANTMSSGFAALAADKENKKSEDAPKPFSFAAPVATSKSSSVFDSKSMLSNNSTFSFGGLGASLGVAATPGTTNAATTAPFSFLGSASSLLANPSSSAAPSTAPASAAPMFATTAKSGPALFSGFGKPVGDNTTATDLTTTPAAPTATSTGYNLGTLGVVAPLVSTSVAPTKPLFSIPATTAGGATTITAVPSTVDTDAIQSVLDSMKVCKPATKEDADKATAPSNLFAGLGTLGDVSSSAFSFGSAEAGGDTAKLNFPSSIANASGSLSFGTTTISVGKPTTTTTSEATGTATVSSTSAATPTAAAASIFSSAAPATTASATVPEFFGAATAATTTPATSTSLFGGSAVFGATATSTAAPAFGSTVPAASAAKTTAPSIFAAAAAATTATTAASSIFAAAAAATTTASSVFASAMSSPQTLPSDGGSIFRGIPKPEQPSFGSPPANLFGAAAANSPFASPTAANAATGGSIFAGSGNATGFGAPVTTGGGSIFNSTSPSAFGAAAPNTTSGGSIFSSAAKPADGANIFGSPTQPAAAAGNTGSLFSSSSFSQSPPSGGNVFGAAAAQPAAPVFGSGGSIFGGTAASGAATGGSIFGGASAAPPAPAFAAPAGGAGFGAFSQNATPAFGSFAQGGASVSQSGFGSPQQASAFAKPVFGGAAAFGSPPAFGAQPSFGGAPTFGSPKSFGSFAAPNTTSPTPGGFGAPPQKNNLFEALGSTDSGLSFGNLAQSTNVNAQKPTFGGDSFMNYRA